MPYPNTAEPPAAQRRWAYRFLAAMLLLLTVTPVGGTVAAPSLHRDGRPVPASTGPQGGTISHTALSLGACCAAGVAWSPDGTTLAVGGSDALRLVQSDGQTVAGVAGLPSPILALAWSPDGQLLATGSVDGLVRIYDASGRATATFGERGTAVNALSWSRDGHLLATASADGGVRVYQSNYERLTTLFAGNHQAAFAVSWSSMHTRHGTLLAYATSAGVRMQTVGGRTIARLDQGQGVHSLSWSPDGQLLVTGLGDGTLHLWSATGAALPAIHGLTGPVTAVAWSPDGRSIAAAADRGVQVWDVVGQPQASLSGPSATVQNLSWSADSHSLAAVSADGILHIWRFPS